MLTFGSLSSSSALVKRFVDTTLPLITPDVVAGPEKNEAVLT